MSNCLFVYFNILLYILHPCIRSNLSEILTKYSIPSSNGQNPLFYGREACHLNPAPTSLLHRTWQLGYLKLIVESRSHSDLCNWCFNKFYSGNQNIQGGCLGFKCPSLMAQRAPYVINFMWHYTIQSPTKCMQFYVIHILLSTPNWSLIPFKSHIPVSMSFL